MTMSLRLMLVVFAAASIVPIIALSGTALHYVQGLERRRAEERILSASKEAASAIDRELRGMLGALETLASSDAAAAPASHAFHARASRVARLLGSNIILLDPGTGKQLLNTRIAHGEPLPTGTDPWALRAASTGVPQVSDIVIGQIARRPLFGMYVPVLRDGEPVAVLASAYEPARLAKVLQETVRSPGWIATAVDRGGKIIARSVQHETFVGKPAPPDPWNRARAGELVIWDAVNLDGLPVLMGSSTSETSGWLVTVLLPTKLLEDPVSAQWAAFLIGSFIAVLASCALAVIFGRQVTRPILALKQHALGMGRGEVPGQMRSHLREADEVAATLREAAMLRRQHEDQIGLLLREINHRSKNMLAVVQAVARQSAIAGPEQFLSAFPGRLAALAKSQDLLVESNWLGADLAGLVRAELDRFASPQCSRLTIEGMQVLLLPSAAQTIAMALHELATNACKYGALSDYGGALHISWRLTDDEQRRFILVWSERTGRPIEVPTKAGFGTKLIRDVPIAALDAAVELTYAEYGVWWSVDAPATSVVNFASKSPRA